MKDSIILQDKTFISAKRAAKLMNYAQDYIGQLCRSGKLDCTMVGRSWFVTEESLYAHRENAIDGTQDRISRSTKFVKSLPKVSNVESKVEVTPVVVVEKIEAPKAPEKKIEFKIEIPKPAPVLSPIQTLKYESENMPLLPEIKKAVPSAFALPKNSKNVLATLSVSFASNMERKVLVKVAKTVSPIGTNFTPRPQLALPAGPRIETRARASIMSAPAITHANQYTTLAITLVALGGFFFTLSIATFQNTRSVTYNQASVSGAATELVSEIMKAIGLRGRSPSTITKTPASAPVGVETAGELNGIGIFPASNPTDDELAKARIINSFSDEVTIRPDQSGAAGVITPVFKKTNGNDFVYVMVPVKEQKQ